MSYTIAPEDVYFVAQALRIAAHQYREDSATCDTACNARARDGFLHQAERTERLADAIEDLG